MQNPRTTSTDTRTVKHNTTKKELYYDRGWGSKNHACLKINIQEEGCGQQVKDSVSLDRQHSRKTYSWGNVHVAMVTIYKYTVKKSSL